MRLLDGGVGHLLKERGVQIECLAYDKQFLAGVVANAERPGDVEAVHRAYLSAGAQVITTNSFAATPYSLARIHREHQTTALIQAACECAKRAVESVGRSADIAGTVPPLRECYCVPTLSRGDLEQGYSEIVKTLQPHVDLLLCETLCSLKEALAAAAVARSTGLPVWVSFTLEDSLEGRLRGGEGLKQSVQSLLDQISIDAILVNCCAPMTCTAALPILQPISQSHPIPFGCYANGFVTTTSQWLRSSQSPSPVIQPSEYGDDGVILCDAYAAYAQQWRDLGATIIGGNSVRHLMSKLRLLVPVKRVIDYNARIRVNATNTGVVTEGVRMSLNPFCEIAVEEALRLREKSAAKDVTIVSIGTEKVQEVLRTSLAMGADSAIHIVTEDQLHPLKIAQLLKALILKQDFQLVIMGKQAIDDDYNQTGQMLAGLLQWPQGTFASKLEILEDGTRVNVRREVDGGLEDVSLRLPAVITTDLRLNEPRYATLPRIMKAKRAPIESLTPSDLSVEMQPAQIEVVRVEEPPKRAQGVMLKSVAELVSKLRNERNVI